MGGEKIFRDILAEQRTELAKERTYLAYIRTGLSILIAGIFFVGFFEDKSLYVYVGYIAICLGALFLLYGFYSYRKPRKIIKKLEKKRSDNNM